MNREIYSKEDADRDTKIFQGFLDKQKKIQEIFDDNKKLRKALGDLYDAGFWTCDREADEEALWIAARDILGREPGNSPKPVEQSDNI